MIAGLPAGRPDVPEMSKAAIRMTTMVVAMIIVTHNRTTANVMNTDDSLAITVDTSNIPGVRIAMTTTAIARPPAVRPVANATNTGVS